MKAENQLKAEVAKNAEATAKAEKADADARVRADAERSAKAEEAERKADAEMRAIAEAERRAKAEADARKKGTAIITSAIYLESKGGGKKRIFREFERVDFVDRDAERLKVIHDGKALWLPIDMFRDIQMG